MIEVDQPMGATDRNFRHVLTAAGIALVLFMPSLANGLAYDDVPLLLGDPRVRPPYAWREVFTRPYWNVPGYEHELYRPLATASFALDWVVANAAPAWAHLVNVLLHAVATALVALLLLEFVAPAAAFCGALIFAAHPAHVEAVANVAGRAELLAGVFFLAACVLWLRRDRAGNAKGRVAAVALCATAAVFSKESAIMLPAVLGLLDFAAGRWELRKASVSAYLRAHGGALAVASSGMAAYLAARFAVLGFERPSILHPAAAGAATAAQLRLTALQAWPEYARLLFFPRTLLIDYGPQIIAPATSWTPAATAGLLLLVGLLGLGGVTLARGRRFVALALLWFPVTIFPVSNLAVTIGVLVAERTLYVPSVALSLGVAGGVAAALRAGSVGWKRFAWVVIGVVALAFSVRSLQRIPEWDSTERIFRALVRDRPDSYRAHWYLGRLERERGDTAAAAAHFAEALRLWPYRERLVMEAAALAVDQRRLGEARALASFATQQWPDNVAAYRLLAATSLDLGDTTTARGAVAAGLRIDPDDDLLIRMREVVFRGGTSHTTEDHETSP